MTVALASNPTGTTLGGTVTVAAVKGVASFTTLTVDIVGTGYTLKATSSGPTAAVSGAFNIVPAAPKIVITAQPPASVTAGSTFGLTVTIEDKFGNLIPTYSGSVAVAISSNPGKSTLGGTLTATVANGVATFSGLTLNKVDAGYTLSLTSGTLAAVITSAIAVTAAPATQLVATTQPPASVTAGAVITFKVSAEDPFGNVDPTFTGSVTVALASNPTGTTLGGTLTVAAVKGVASFTTLTVDIVGTGYTLKATSSKLTAAVSGAFNVVPAAPKVVITAQPPASVTAGSTFGLTVTIEDKFGNLIPTYSGSVAVAISSNPGKSTLGGTLTATVTNGVATFSGLTLNKVDPGYTLSLTSGTLAAVITSAIAVTAAPATQLVATTQPPASVTAGAAITFKVSAEDPFGNVDPTFTGSVTVALASNPTGTTLGGTVTVAAVKGVASFTTLTVDLVGTGYTLKATSSKLTAAVSGAFDVVPAAPKIVITAQPPASVTAGSTFGLTVTIEDKFGNLIPTYSGSVAVAISSNPGKSTLGGTLTATVTNGVATFSGLTLNKVDAGYTLSLTSGTLAAVITSAIAVTPSTASQLVVTTQPPASVTAGAGFALTVTAEDKFGNVATAFTGSVTVALDSNPTGTTLGGTLTLTAVKGVAAFTGLKLNLVATGYTLQATTTGLTTAVTGALSVVPAAASQLVVMTQPPAGVTAGTEFGFAVVAEDKYGNLVTSFTGTMTVAIGVNPGGSTLGGTLTVTAVAGVASFSDLTLNNPGTGYTLKVSATGLTGITSSAFNVT